MNNNQTDIILEIQKSVDSMIRLGQNLETLDSRFGRLNQRIATMQSSFDGLDRQISGRSGSKLQNQFQRKANDPLQDDETRSGHAWSKSSNPGSAFKKKIERTTESFNDHLSRNLQKELDSLNKMIDEIELSPSAKLKRYLNSQMDLFNSKLIQKIREQAHVQMNSLLQEISMIQSMDKSMNLSPSALNATGGGASTAGSKTITETDSKQGNTVETTAKKENQTNPLGLHVAAFNSIRNMLSGKYPDVTMAVLNKAAETFQKTQAETAKMTQSLMFKKDYQTNHTDGSSTVDMSKINATISNLQSFMRQQSAYYGTDYYELFQVGNMGANALQDPVEIKKFIQLTAQLKTLNPSSSSINIAKGLESVKSQFGLEMADMQKQVAEPLAVISNLTSTPVEQLLNSVKRVGSTMSSADNNPTTAAVLAGASVRATSFNEGNVSKVYSDMLKKLESEKGMNLLNQLGLKTSNIDAQTGIESNKSGDEIIQDLSKTLATKDEKTRKDTYNSLFGSSGSSKDAAAMNELMNNFIKMNEAVKEVTNDGLGTKYKEMIQKSLSNPMVNANRAQQKFTIAFDAIVQELTPSINKVSYAFMNMASFVERNALLFARLGEVISNVMIGMLMLKGIKWGAGKIGKDVGANFETQRMRSGFLGGISALEGTGLIGNDIKGLSRKYVGQLQKNPLLDGYIKEMNSMNEEQQKHLKNYITTKNMDVKDLPTLFTAMNEAKNWSAREPLTENEKFDRQKQYNNRLATRPDSASFIHPAFMSSMLGGTTDSTTYSNFRRHTPGYADLSDKLTSMNQKEFRGFEDHLADRNRNGLPPVKNYQELSQALVAYEKTQRQADAAARQASPTFGTLSNAIRGVNSEISRTQALRNGFKQFLKDIPDLGKGAAVSLKNLAGGIAKLALEIASAIGLAQAGKSMMENFTSTDDQRKLNQADALDSNAKDFANTLRIDGKGDQWSGESIGNMLFSMYGSAMNGISRFFGATETHYGVGNQFDLYNKMMSDYNFNGSMYDFAEYLKQKGEAEGKTSEDYVREWYAKSEDGKKSAKLREEAASMQYKDAQLKATEEEKLQKIAKQNYEEKYKSGNDANLVNESSVKQRVKDKLSDVKNRNNLENLRALMSGMKTDSDEYLSMRRGQITKLRQVLDEELATIDKYISNAKAIMANSDPSSEQYKNASESLIRLQEIKQKVQDDGEAEINQEEFQQRQDEFQKNTNKVSRELQKIDLLSQAKELAAANNMDTQSQAYLDVMKKIALNKLASMKSELENLKAIQASGDQTNEKAMQILQLQNSIAGEQSKIKDYNLASIGIGAQKLQEHNSERENALLRLKLMAGNPDDDSPVLRNKRIANAKAEISEIQSIISNLQQRLTKNIEAGEASTIQAQIRDLQKQSLQAQLGILDELKGSAGTFNLPDGVTAMTRYEYLTRQGTHNTTTVGMGDVTVNITLPNVTNTTTPQQLQSIGQGIGQGFSQGRIGGVRTQLGGNPTINYRSRYA
ncbi:hypothetical protein GRF59_05595 [Paenibacillus sp. HJL G12]|uniref:Phage tail tape measure protein domain-containing protein n=1 Tax=Paenibacillus dendrobii TaxID=2691084 RepID=A0A7X3IFS1_9BACL|nr:hypothetical protein [Paenibacillus dendrobii]MWV43098.1 hypothetical protein [Paenibacillus dendrobii]